MLLEKYLNLKDAASIQLLANSEQTGWGFALKYAITVYEQEVMKELIEKVAENDIKDYAIRIGRIQGARFVIELLKKCEEFFETITNNED